MRNGLIILLLGPLVMAQTRPATAPATRPFELARETTYFTGPVRADGSVDYVGAINKALSEGVTKENNAAALLVDVLEQQRDKREAHFNRVRAELGLAAKPAAGDGPGDDPWAEPEGFDDVLKRVWTGRDAPRVEAYLKALGPKLDTAVEASKRDRYFMPLVREKADDSMITILLPHLHTMRPLCSALRARALLRLGNDDVDGYFADALAIIRIGRLTSSSSTLIEKLVAASCESMGLETLAIGATGGWLSPKQAKEMLDQLDRVAASPFAESFSLGERCFMLEFLQAAALHGGLNAMKMLQGEGGPGNNMPIIPPDPATKDWNAAMKKANAWYDRFGEAGREPTFEKRRTANKAIEDDIIALKVRYEGWRAVFAPLEDRLFMVLLPAVGRAFDSETRLQAQRDLARVALGLSLYRAKTGEFPDKLEELAPGVMKTVPNNPFTDKPMNYARDGNGYTLSSPGSGKDDGLLMLRATR